MEDEDTHPLTIAEEYLSQVMDEQGTSLSSKEIEDSYLPAMMMENSQLPTDQYIETLTQKLYDYPQLKRFKTISPVEGAAEQQCPTTKKRTQYCMFCKNHKKEVPKKGHLCPYKDCKCVLCELLRKAQITMRHQQRVWRHQKFKLQTSNDKFEDLTDVLTENSRGQMCDKCRNHNKLTLKKNHQCPHDSCTCQYCALTYKRRELMKLLQRVRRSNLTSNASSEESQEKSKDYKHPHKKELGTRYWDDEKSTSPPLSVDSDRGDNSAKGSDESSDLFPSGLTATASSCSSEREKDGEIEDMEFPSAPSPPPAIPSPPPLIPLSIMHQHNFSLEEISPSPQNESEGGGANEIERRETCFYPPTCSLYPEEETVLQASTRILSRLGRLPPKYYRHLEMSASCSSLSNRDFTSAWKKSFGVEKPSQSLGGDSEQEQLHLRHYWWPSSSASVIYSHSVYDAQESHPGASAERQHLTDFPAPALINPPVGLRFPPQIRNSPVFVPPFMAARQMNTHGMECEDPPMYYQEDRLD